MLKLIRHLLYSIAALSVFFVLHSCSTFDPPLVVPAYGHIDSIHFNVPIDSIPRQGSASANIQYAWVYLDDNPVGSFQMPCTFPMIASNGLHNVKIYPGVTPAGGSDPASIYPFYQFYSVDVKLQQGVTTKLQPTSAYYVWSEFPLMENFKGSGEVSGGQPKYIVNFYGGGNASGKSDTAMHITNNPKLEYNGNPAGMVIVDNGTHSYYIGMTNPAVGLPNSSTPVFMELNYRCTAVFAIGLFSADTVNQSAPIVLVYPTNKWTKMYVALNTTIAAFDIGQIYRMYFTMSLDATDGHTRDTLLLDNIKILD